MWADILGDEEEDVESNSEEEDEESDGESEAQVSKPTHVSASEDTGTRVEETPVINSLEINLQRGENSNNVHDQSLLGYSTQFIQVDENG